MKISIDEQAELRARAKKELDRLEEVMNDKQIMQLLDKYKNKFNLCESTYKVVLAEHQLKTKGKQPTQLKLQMTQVPFAMAFAGYNIDRDLLNRLFGAKCDKGRTAKKLRDAVTHNLEQAAIAEIEARQSELFADMDTFLEIIRAAEGRI